MCDYLNTLLYFPVMILQRGFCIQPSKQALAMSHLTILIQSNEAPNNSLAPTTLIRRNGMSYKPKSTLRLKIQYRASHSISQQSYFSRTNQIHKHDLWGILNVYITCVISQMFCRGRYPSTLVNTA